MSENKLSPSLPAPNGAPTAYGEYDTGFVFEHYVFPDMWDYGSHAHPMMQYSMVLSGNLAYSIGQNQYVIPAGSGFLSTSIGFTARSRIRICPRNFSRF